MKRSFFSIILVFTLLVALCWITPVEARDMRGNYNFTGEVNIDTGGRLKLKGTEVTATAAELNAVGATQTDLDIAEAAIVTETNRAQVAEALLASKADVWGAPTATPSTNLLVNTVAIQAKTAAGGDLSEFRLIRVWTSETSMGSASTNNIITLVLSTGTAVDTVTANADYRYVTATAGSAVATITATAAGTNYVMLMDGSSVSATAITFE